MFGRGRSQGESESEREREREGFQVQDLWFLFCTCFAVTRSLRLLRPILGTYNCYSDFIRGASRGAAADCVVCVAAGKSFMGGLWQKSLPSNRHPMLPAKLLCNPSFLNSTP